MFEILLVIAVVCIILIAYIYFYRIKNQELRLHLFSEPNYEGDKFTIKVETMPDVLLMRINHDRPINHILPDDVSELDIPKETIGGRLNSMKMGGEFIRRLIRTDVAYRDEPDAFHVQYGTIEHLTPKFRAPVDYIVFYFD